MEPISQVGSRSVPALGAAEIHVWRIPLNVGPRALAAYEAVLSPEEQDRRRSFRFARHARRFAVRRGALRQLLGRYLDCPPHEIQYETNPFGKPALAPRSDVRFSLSHSNELAIAAVMLRHELGVDVEFVRPEFARETIAEQFFARAEITALRQLAPKQQAASFFRCWTSKEAYIKAVGMGLSMPLDLFEVNVAPNEDARLLTVRGSAEDARRWRLRTLPVPCGYMATLAIASEREPGLRTFDWVGGET